MTEQMEEFKVKAEMRRPVGFTVLSIIGMISIVQYVLWFLLMAKHEGIINFVLRILCFILITILIYGLWTVKKWILRVYIPLIVLSLLAMFFQMNQWMAVPLGQIAFMYVMVSLWCMLICTLVGIYIHFKLKERYPG